MSKELYTLNLDELKSFVSLINAKKLDETTIQDFNNTYELDIEILSPRSLYQVAEGIERRVQKQFSLDPGFSKTKLINIWHLGEKTLLFCTLIYYLTLRKISIQSITEKDLLPLKKIFLTKNISLLLFQAKHLLSKTMLKKNEWKQEDIEILLDIMVSKKEEFMRNEKCFRWKEVSYDIFRQSNTGEFYSAKDCRQKWINHLNPQLVKSTWSYKEDLELFIALNEFGCKWSLISKKTGGLRTEHMVKKSCKCSCQKGLQEEDKEDRKQAHHTCDWALRDRGLSVQQESKGDSNQQEAQIKKEVASEISEDIFDEEKMEILDNSLDFGTKQKNVLECDDTYNRLLIQNEEDQWEYNEQPHSFNFLGANQFNYHEDLLSYFQ